MILNQMQKYKVSVFSVSQKFWNFEENSYVIINLVEYTLFVYIVNFIRTKSCNNNKD